MIHAIQNGRIICTTFKFVLDDRKKETIEYRWTNGSISLATRRVNSYEATRSNVQVRSTPARELRHSDKRAVTALERKLDSAVVPELSGSWGRGFLPTWTIFLLKKQEVDRLFHRCLVESKSCCAICFTESVKSA